MAAPTIRINEKTLSDLREIAKHTGQSVQAVLDRAIEEYRRKMFLEEANAAFDALRKDSKAWAQEETERAEWDATLTRSDFFSR